MSSVLVWESETISKKGKNIFPSREKEKLYGYKIPQIESFFNVLLEGWGGVVLL